MSYLVLARKYRPATFSEVVGQEHVTRTLANAFASGRVHHAFLFCGPRGCGKTTLARIVGKALNCEQRTTTPGSADPCNSCSACTSIQIGSAVDYQEMDGASNRGIDAIRELTEAVRYQPAVLRKKVYVIDEVHMLTTEAFNALLKTLEEPPPHVTFVLATTEPHKLPNTILSRCQRYDFKLVPGSRLAAHLHNIFTKEKLVIEANAISLLVRESGGSVRDALSLGDQLISYVGDGTITEQHVAEVLGVADRSLTRTLVRALASGHAGLALSSVESAIERGVDEVQIARAIVRYLRDLSVLQVAPNRLELVDASDEERTELLGESRELERSRVTQMFERMLRCCDELGKTLQPRLVLDCALIDVATVEPLVPLGDLVERLSELEARIVSRVTPAGRTQRSPTAPEPPAARMPSVVPTRPAAEQAVAVAKAPVIEVHAGGGTSKTEVVTTTPVRQAPPSFATGTDSGSKSPIAKAPGRSSTSGAPPKRKDSSEAAPAEHVAPSGGPQSGLLAKGTTPGMRAGAEVAALVEARVSSAASAKASTSGAATPSASTASSTASPTASTASPTASTASPTASTASPTASTASPTASTASPTASTASPTASTASIEPSGPVPKAPAVASGSGPTEGLVASPSDVMQAWNVVLGELEARRKFSLLGPFQHARVMKWNADEIELGFPIDVHSMGEMANERQHLDDLGSIIRELSTSGELAKVKVTVRMLDAAESGAAQGQRSVLEDTRAKSAAEKQKREAEAREHPITKHVLQTFGAQIKEIKTDV